MTSPERSLYPASGEDRRSFLSTIEFVAGGAMQLGEMVGTVVGQCMTLEPRPKVFDSPVSRCGHAPGACDVPSSHPRAPARACLRCICNALSNSTTSFFYYSGFCAQTRGTANPPDCVWPNCTSCSRLVTTPTRLIVHDICAKTLFDGLFQHGPTNIIKRALVNPPPPSRRRDACPPATCIRHAAAASSCPSSPIHSM